MADPAVSAQALSALLADERAALTAGDLAALRRLAERKDAILRALPRQRLDASTLTRLRTDAARNDALLAAHAAGLRAAMARVDALTKPGDPIASYDGTGARTSIGASKPGFERRS